MFSRRIAYFVKCANGIPYVAPVQHIRTAYNSAGSEIFVSDIFDVVNTKYKGK
jgi:hypothetical protein